MTDFSSNYNTFRIWNSHIIIDFKELIDTVII